MEKPRSVSVESGRTSVGFAPFINIARNRLAVLFAGILPILACSQDSSQVARSTVPTSNSSTPVARTSVHDDDSELNEDDDAGVDDDAGIEEDAGGENDDVNESGPVITDTDEGIDLGDFSPNEGMGQAIVTLTRSLRVRPRHDAVTVTFVNPAPTGWSYCGTRFLPRSIITHGNPTLQNWWDAARNSLPSDRCSTINVERQLPFGFSVGGDDTFEPVSAFANSPYKPGAHISMREHLRRNFLLAFHETELYVFLEARYPDLAEQFARLAINGVAAQESSFGRDVTVSRTGARGVMQTQRSAYIDARRNPAWARSFLDRRGRPMKVRFNSTLHTTPWQSARVAAIEFDNIFRHFRSTWTDPSHPVWRYPEAFLVPALLGAYNSGPTRITNMLTRRLADADLAALIRGNNREAIMNRGYLLASTQHFLDRTDPNYGRESLAYVPMVYAWDALFQGDNAATTSDAGVPSTTASSRPAVGSTILSSASHESTVVSPGRSASPWARARLDDIRGCSFVRTGTIPLRANVRFSRAAWEFATGNVSQGNVRVHAWLLANDPTARRYANGVPNDRALQSKVHDLVQDRTLVAADPHRFPLLAFDGANILESWRRVIRRDHIPIIERLTEEVNDILRVGGMSPELFVIPMINSTVRSVEANDQLRGHSSRSAHLMFTGIDLSRRQFVVMRRMRDGSYERAISTDAAAAEVYFQALIQASVRLARQGMLFVRYHGPPQHFHIVPRVRVNNASRRHRR